MRAFQSGVGSPVQKMSSRLGQTGAPFATALFGDTLSTADPQERTFRALVDGPHTFFLWGAGGQGTTGNSNRKGGGSGAYARVTRDLRAGQEVQVIVGVSVSASASRIADTTVTFPDGLAVKAEGGKSPVGGVAAIATGGDVNLPGSIVPREDGSGCDAPGEPGAPGGLGGNYNSRSNAGTSSRPVKGGAGTMPGGGGGNGNNTSTSNNSTGSESGDGAPGLVIIAYGRAS